MFRSKRNMAIRMNETTGTDFIRVTAGEKSASAIFDDEQIHAKREENGIATAIPITPLKSDEPIVLQKSASSDSSASLASVSIGEGNISGFPTANDAASHKRSQNAAAASGRLIFLSAFIYPKIPSSGIAPPIDVGTCAKSAPQNSVSPFFISSPTR